MFMAVIASPSDSFSVNFSINPVRIFFDSSKKTDIVTIRNESAIKVALQINVVAWTQDEIEDNVYSPTEDILFFPKLLELAPGEERIVRIGIKVPHAETEKTYRLFFEEMPDNSQVDTTAVKIIMKVGVPIFISPLKANASGLIHTFGMANSALSVGIRNEGNIHFIIKSMRVVGKDASGKELYTAEKAGGYLHHGKSKSFTFDTPQDMCRGMKTLSLHIETDRFEMGKELDIAREMCGT